MQCIQDPESGDSGFPAIVTNPESWNWRHQNSKILRLEKFGKIDLLPKCYLNDANNNSSNSNE